MLDLSKMTNEIAEEQLEYTKKIKDETTKANTLAKLNAALNYATYKDTKKIKNELNKK
jgi:hypothetical protein